jgi:long-chain acyl-CoA synthetase
MLLARPRIVGRDRLKELRGPVLFVSNHVTQVDIGFILAALPPRFRHWLAVAMQGELLREMRHPSPQLGLFRRAVKKASYALVAALFNVFPLPQQTGFRESFAYAGESVDRGHSILVFPEGRRTTDGKLSPFRAGVGMLAKNLGLPVVPVRILGLWEVKQSRRKFARRGAITVVIGSALHLQAEADAAAIAAEIERAVTSLENCPSLFRKAGL